MGRDPTIEVNDSPSLQTVRVTAEVDIALRAVLVLADIHPRRMTARELCRHEGISYRFLSTALRALGNAGLVTGKRGTGGGYSLARSPSDITIAAVFIAADSRNPARCPGSARTAPLWQSLELDNREHLARVSVRELAQRRVRPISTPGHRPGSTAPFTESG